MNDIYDFLKGVACGAILAVAVTVTVFALSFVPAQEEKNRENTWGESAEFTQLESGQDRFSLHNTNVKDFPIIVDHSTGIIYMRHVGVLVDENGEPLRVLEVGE